MREEDLNPYDLYEVAQAQRERAGGLRAVRGILGPRSDDEEPPEITIRRGRGDSDAELYEYMRGLWAEEKKDNARLKAELAALKARRCETCRHCKQWTTSDGEPRAACTRLSDAHKVIEFVVPERDGCSRWQDKETADG